MTIQPDLTLTHIGADPGHVPTARRLRQWVARLVARAAAAEAMERDLKRLETLPEHLLRDIGLGGCDARTIAQILRYGRAD